MHNGTFIDKKLESEKTYLDTILSDVDPHIMLDDDQRRVILTDEDYCLVIAGAGAGKTTTVAAKVKYLVEKKGINPREILVVSFTNKAVGELQAVPSRRRGSSLSGLNPFSRRQRNRRSTTLRGKAS